MALSVALLLLTGCGKKVGSVSGTDTVQSEISLPEVISVTTVVPTTEAVTRPSHDIPDKVILNISEEDIEVYSDILVSDIVTGTNTEILNGDDPVRCDKTGDMSTDILFEYEGQLYEKSVNYSVVDTKEPVVLNMGSNAIIRTGDSFDPDSLVGYADNYDRDPLLECSGAVDTSTPGKYPVSATVTDSSGNSVSWDFTVTVADIIPEPEDDNPRLSFDTLISLYSGEGISFGIDVSKWQGDDIDFQQVKNAGCSFVIMRIGSYYDENEMDVCFQRNMEKAVEAGLDVGVYFYTTASDEEHIRENARWIADNLGGQHLDFPIGFDWESFSNFQRYGMSIHDLNGYFEAFADEMGKYDYDTMLYSSKNFLNNFWDVPDEYPVWLAHYTDRTDYQGEYFMWQMSCYGRIPGINGDVDLDILYT